MEYLLWTEYKWGMRIKQHGPYSIYDNADERMKWQGAGGIMNSCRLWAGKESSWLVGFTATVRKSQRERREAERL